MAPRIYGHAVAVSSFLPATLTDYSPREFGDVAAGGP
jgi:hypothetical protein